VQPPSSNPLPEGFNLMEKPDHIYWQI